MKAYASAFFLFAIFLFPQMYAQDYAKLLSEYKKPELLRYALTMDAALGGYLRYDKDADGDSGIIFRTYRTGTINGDISFDLSRYRNTPRIQSNDYIRLDVSGNYYESELKETGFDLYKSTRETYRYRNNLSAGHTIRYYPGDFVFYGAMPRGNYGSNHYESVNTSHYEVADDSREKSENYRSELSFVIPLEIGIGRIEEITDMRQAIFIVEALVDAGRVSRAPSEEEMRDFAELISELKNERFFDSRLRRIKELKVIDSFLKDNSLLAENDATYFSTLTDIWDFGREFIRSSGFRAGLVVSGGHRIEYYRNTNDYSRFSSRVNDSNIEAGIRFSWEIPVSLSWQHSFYSSFYFNRHSVNNKDEDPYSKNVTSLNGIDVNLSHTIGYYPNTRTNLILTYGGRYNVRKYTCANCDYLKPDSKQLSLNIHAGVYYYVSSQIGISGSYSYYHSQNGKDTDSSYLFKDTNHSFSVGMSYSIF
jgi:hypothetical protein